MNTKQETDKVIVRYRFQASILKEAQSLFESAPLCPENTVSGLRFHYPLSSVKWVLWHLNRNDEANNKFWACAKTLNQIETNKENALLAFYTANS